MSNEPSGNAVVGVQPDVDRMRGVLVRSLPDAAAADAALTKWTSDYSGLPGFGVVRFVQELGKLHDLSDAQRRDLRMSLFREIYSVVSGGRSGGRPAAVAGASAPVGPSTKAAPASVPPVAHVGHAMLVALAEAAGREQAQDFAEHLRSFCNEAGDLPQAVLTPIRAWDGQSRTWPVVDADADTLRLLVHAGYNALCDAVGPSKADKGLASAVRRAEALEAAAEVSPRELL